VVTLSVRQRSACAAATLFGNYGAVPRRAHQHGLCRQTVYRQTDAVRADREAPAQRQEVLDLRQQLDQAQARCAATEPMSLAETVLDRQRPVPDDVVCRIDSREILDQLPTGDAQLLRLHAEGRTAQEIGMELNLKAGAVRVRLSRLIKRVRGKFQNTNPEADHD